MTRREPLRVAVYNDLAAAIRSGEFPAGERIPSEVEIAERCNVSRLTAREALLLLQEDGFLVNQRGQGRFVVERVPEAGLAGIRPVDQMLAERQVKTSLHRVVVTTEAATEYSAEALEVALGSDTVLLDSELRGEDGRAVCLSLEWLPVRAPFAESVDQALDAVSGLKRYLLDFVTDRHGDGITASRYQISVTTAGDHRGRRLGVARSAPVLVLARIVYHRAGPLLASKHVVRSDVAHFTGMESISIA